MNIHTTRFTPPRRAFINPRGTATRLYRYNPQTKKMEPANEAARVFEERKARP